MESAQSFGGGEPAGCLYLYICYSNVLLYDFNLSKYNSKLGAWRMRLRQDELTVYIYFLCVRLHKSNRKTQLCAGCLRKDLSSSGVYWPVHWLQLPTQLILTHCLLAHSTLVCVPGRLIVMWIRNETSTHAEQREGFDLQVCRVPTE